ncbi:MAG: hypothetical protein ROO70_14975 [Labrenzia sp.]
MTVFSIINNAQQQQFNLQMRGRIPDTAKLPQNTDAAESDKQEAKAAEKTLKTAELLVETTSAQTGDRQSEGDDLVEDFKDAVDLNAALTRVVKDGADVEREIRIERMAQEIKRMKEMLKFATPEKAKRMLQELQQVSKEFKTASLELRKAAEKIGPDTPNRVVDVAAEATVFALDRTGKAPTVTNSDLLAYAEDFTSSLVSIQQPTQSHLSPSLTPPAPDHESNSGDNSTGQDRVETATSIFEALEATGFIDRLEADLAAKNQSAFRKASVYAYADRQHQSDSIYRQSRIEGMRAEHDALSQLFKEIKLLAGQLESLVDKDDEEVQEAMLSLIKNLAEGYAVLDAEDLQQFLGAGHYASPGGATPSGPSVMISANSVSVETSVSISISGIVA